MNNMHRLLAPLLACGCWLSAVTTPAAPTDPAQIMNEAYISLVQGDQSLEASRLDEALAQYQEARGYYLQLAKDFPDWEPRIIQYRKTYCDNQIADIERRRGFAAQEELPELEPLPSEVPAPAPVPEPAAAPAGGERSVEVDYLKSRIASLEAELAGIDALQGEVDALAAKNEQLRQDLDSANRQLAERASGEQSALASLQAELSAKDQQIQALRNDLEAKKQLDQALNDMEAKLNELRAQNERLDKEIKTLDAELDEAEVRADQAELRAQKAEKDIREAQKDVQKAEKEALKARERQEETEQRLADARRKPTEPPAPAKEEPARAAKAEPAPAAAAASPVKASVPPKTVPKGMVASDFVRQLLQEGDNESALATVQEARKAYPTDMNLVLIEGIALIRLQRYPEAATMLIDLAKNNPRNAEIHATLGAAMMGAGFYEEARETLLKAIRLDKNVGGEYYYNLAQLYALVDPVDVKVARKYYQQARNLGVPADALLEKAMK